MPPRSAEPQTHTVVTGAGPAGLTAAWQLTRDEYHEEVHYDADVAGRSVPRRVGG